MNKTEPRWKVLVIEKSVSTYKLTYGDNIVLKIIGKDFMQNIHVYIDGTVSIYTQEEVLGENNG